MSVPAPQPAPPRLDRVLATIRARFGAPERDQIARFATALFGKDVDYIEEIGEDAAAAAAAQAFRFFAAEGAVPRVRAFVPTFGVNGWETPVAIVETVMPDRPFIVDTIRE